ncbi:hypothetical protein BCR32DRAFT_263734 [Anaeromyces robustus]|uniref:Uncharacterized protein n=1 Tax=Anaeromyces robustus TaxID=1754192 RepID=A0A1Y1XRE8_9FUNG|nr:hypothetical protein BCR32DRAFT_263734 [Anaeromyces robustus]|eukprot:ORX88307.1 hypothetical protein BCR32DRAFT_263734 [Anaeromyces robustus]
MELKEKDSNISQKRNYQRTCDNIEPINNKKQKKTENDPIEFDTFICTQNRDFCVCKTVKNIAPVKEYIQYNKSFEIIININKKGKFHFSKEKKDYQFYYCLSGDDRIEEREVTDDNIKKFKELNTPSIQIPNNTEYMNSLYYIPSNDINYINSDQITNFNNYQCSISHFSNNYPLQTTLIPTALLPTTQLPTTLLPTTPLPTPPLPTPPLPTTSLQTISHPVSPILTPSFEAKNIPVNFNISYIEINRTKIFRSNKEQEQKPKELTMQEKDCKNLFFKIESIDSIDDQRYLNLNNILISCYEVTRNVEGKKKDDNDHNSEDGNETVDEMINFSKQIIKVFEEGSKGKFVEASPYIVGDYTTLLFNSKLGRNNTLYFFVISIDKEVLFVSELISIKTYRRSNNKKKKKNNYIKNI